MYHLKPMTMLSLAIIASLGLAACSTGPSPEVVNANAKADQALATSQQALQTAQQAQADARAASQQTSMAYQRSLQKGTSP